MNSRLPADRGRHARRPDWRGADPRCAPHPRQSTRPRPGERRGHRVRRRRVSLVRDQPPLHDHQRANPRHRNRQMDRWHRRVHACARQLQGQQRGTGGRTADIPHQRLDQLRMILPHRTGEPITDRELPHVEPTTRRASDNVRGHDRPLACAHGGRRQDERPAPDLRDPQNHHHRHPRQAGHSQLPSDQSRHPRRNDRQRRRSTVRSAPCDKLLGPGRETVDGTEFDAGGSRSFVINLHYTITNGRTLETGTGRWTGGTGAYTRAHGTFKVSGGGPVGGVHTVRLIGNLSHGDDGWLVAQNPLRKESEC